VIELRRGDELTRSWPDDQLVAALEAFWSALLEEGMLHERWYPSNLSLPDGGDLQVSRYDTRSLRAIGVRRFETGFIQALATLHAQHLDGPLSVLLDLPPAGLPERVEQIIAVLRRALSFSAPLKHLGERGNGLAPKGAAFSLLESRGVYANGAGGMTSVDEWQLDLREPIRLRVMIEASDEYGRDTEWDVKVIAPIAAPLEPLLDAFKEQEISFRVEKVAALAD
jgi:hypothetical protein